MISSHYNMKIDLPDRMFFCLLVYSTLCLFRICLIVPHNLGCICILRVLVPIYDLIVLDIFTHHWEQNELVIQTRTEE